MSAVSEKGNVLSNLKAKMQALRDDLDNVRDEYDAKCKECVALIEDKNQYEQEIASLNRKLMMAEDKLQSVEDRLESANSKLESTSQMAEDSARQLKVMESRNDNIEDLLTSREQELHALKEASEERDRMYDEVARKLVISDSESTKTEQRAESAESKLKDLEDELHVLSNTVRSLEINDNKAASKEVSYEETIRDLRLKLEETETLCEEHQASCRSLSKENAKLEDDLSKTKDAHEVLKDELERTLNDLNDM